MNLKLFVLSFFLCMPIIVYGKPWSGIEVNPYSLEAGRNNNRLTFSGGYNRFYPTHGLELSVPILHAPASGDRESHIADSVTLEATAIDFRLKKYYGSTVQGVFLSTGICFVKLRGYLTRTPFEKSTEIKAGASLGVGYRVVLEDIDIFNGFRRNLFWSVSYSKIYYFSGENNVFDIRVMFQGDDDAKITYDIEILKFGIEL